MLTPVRIVTPASEPVTLAEAKAHLRVDANTEDTLIALYISAAVSALDGWSGLLGRCLITQTWRQDFDGFGNLKLPFPNVASATIAYTDANGVTQTWAATNYQIVNGVGGSCIVPKAGASIPGTAAQPDAVRVTFVAGYGAAADVPPDLKTAILLHIGHLYANRESVSTGKTVTTLPQGYDAHIAPHRRVGT